MAGGFAFYYWQSSKLKRLAVEPQRIAILRFENQSGDAELDPVGVALAMSLADQVAALDRTDAFVVGSAGEAAGRQATLLVHGRIEDEKGRYRVSASLERLSNREFEGAGSAAGERQRIPELLSTIADGIRSAVRPKGKLSAPEFKTLAASIGLGRSLETASAEVATAELRKAVEAEPGCGTCWRRLVEVNLAAGAKEPAIAFAQASRSKNISAYSRAFIDLALAAGENDREKQSIALERLATLRPGDYEFQARLGGVQASLGRWQNSVAAYRRAVETAPYHSGLWNEFGYALVWAGRPDEGMRALDEYARLEPNSANPPDSKGEVALISGRFGEAIQHFEESYRKDPKFNNGAALEKAAYAAYLEGNKARAGSYVDRFLDSLGGSAKPGSRLIRARWQMAFGDVAGAVEGFEKLDPAVAALVVAAGGDLEEAGRRMKANPAVGGAGIRFVLAGEGRFPGQAAEMAELAPARGLSAALRGRWGEAGAELSKALLRIPANTPKASLMREAIAWTLVMEKKHAEAAKLVGSQWPLPGLSGFDETSLLVYPNLFYTRAEIALSQGKKDEARKQYDLFVQYSGGRKDNFGMIARARAASRL